MGIRGAWSRFLWRDGVEGGTAIIARRLNDLWDFVYGLDIDVDTLEDRVGNQTGQTGLVRYFTGTTAERAAVSPTFGTAYLNTTTKRWEYGWGTEWRDGDGVLIAAGGGGGGTSGAPQNPYARTNPDGSIDTGCDPVTGASSYNLYELRQSAALATGLATPTSHRTPGGIGTYGYSWAAMVGGVETARSAIAYCARPYGATVDPQGGSSGGGTTDTPADLLRIGDEGGFWSIDVGNPNGSGNVHTSLDDVLDGFSRYPNFTALDDKSGVQFLITAGAGTTENSEYPRSELRERNSDGSKAAWDPSNTKQGLSVTLKVTDNVAQKPELVALQIHDDRSDALQVRLEGTTWRLKVNEDEIATPLLSGYSLGTDVAFSVVADRSLVTVKVNGAEKWSGRPGWSGKKYYYKTGMYLQSNVSKGNSTNDAAALIMKTGTLLRFSS